ncbi:hypothetical protein EZN00_02704 [Clostridium tyrobutyricum]|jgi:uncharacterized MnhB-related membrane protein|nr:hypothetical protein EZN00_02704 [Clostridium tyrobutyricum]
MKSNKLFQMINFLIIFLVFFLTFFIGFEIIKLKNNIINYIILGAISSCLVQLYIKIVIKQNNS